MNIRGGGRHEWRRWLCILVLLVAAPSSRIGAAGEIRTVDVEGLRITIDSEWATRTAPGYYPVRFDITNSGEPRVIEIFGFGTRFLRVARSSQPGGLSVRQPVRLARGDRVRLTIPVPVFADNENIRFEIREDGRTLERFNYTGFQSRVVASSASALVIADPATHYGRMAPGWLRRVTPPSGMSTSGRPTPLIDFILDPSRVPNNWLGFTSLRAVLVGPEEWRQLNEDQKAALLTWTACGGDLIFVDGTVDALLPSGKSLAVDQPVRAYFFGRIHTPPSTSLGSGGVVTAVAAADKARDTSWGLPANSAKDWATIAERGFRLPIPGIHGVPARTYLAILLVFSVLVGPVNYWFLRRKGRQVLLVLTAPLISAVFIVLLAVYVIAGEGIGVRGRAVTFTMLDQVRRQAAMRGSMSLYAAGMSPRDGLRFPRDVAIFALGRDGHGVREQMTLDLSESQRFANGLVQARAPANLEQIAFRPARERLAITRDSNGVSVVNGLGARIVVLLYRDSANTYHLTRPLAVGETATLTAGGVDPMKIVPTALPITARLLYLIQNQPAGSDIAVLERSPFWEPGVSDVIEHDSFHVVLGWPEGQP